MDQRTAANNLMRDKSISSPAQNSIRRLDELEGGQAGLIVSIKARSPEQLQELIAIGISPCSIVRMIENYAHHVVFKVDHKKFAADKEIASEIFVRTV